MGFGVDLSAASGEKGKGPFRYLKVVSVLARAPGSLA